MKSRIAALIAALSCVLIVSCAHRSTSTSILPPRFDLKQFESIGLIEFGSTTDEKLAELTSRRFVEMARRDQGLVTLVDLGPMQITVEAVGPERWDPATIQAIGRERDVQTVVVGALLASENEPEVVLDVRLIETATGAAIWRRTAQATRDAGPAESIDRQLVDSLVTEVTRDFRVTWEQSFYY